MKYWVILLSFLLSMTVSSSLILAKEAPKMSRPFYQGEILSILHGGGYSYFHIKEQSQKTLWIVTSRINKAKVGDYIRFQKEFVTKNFTSKFLKRTFTELMFTSNISYRKKHL